MKKFLNTHLTLVLWRIVLMYIVLGVCQIIFYFYNKSLIIDLDAQQIIKLLPGALRFNTPSILYTNLLWLTLALIPTPLRAKNWYQNILFWIFMVTNSLTILVTNFIDTIYFRYTQKRLTMEELFFAENDNTLSLMVEFFKDNWWLFLLMCAMIYLLSKAYLRKLQPAKTSVNAWSYYPLHTAIFIMAVYFIIGGIRGGLLFIHKDTRPITPSNAAIYTTDMAKVNLILSNPFCIIRSLGQSTPTNINYFDKATADALFTPYHFPEQYITDSTLKYKDYNVVIVIMESFSAENSAFLSPHLYEDDDKGYMPFLDSLMRNGLTFKQMHANGGRSIQAMPAILGSIPSLMEAFVSMPQSLGESRQLPKMLADKGYTTSFFCGSSRQSMGFAAYATMAGVNVIRSREDYEKKHGKKDFDGSWGIWDEPFLQFMGEEISSMNEPFMASIFTLSAHHPFAVPEKYKDILPKGKTKIQPGTAYDDMAFAKFFERFSKEKWFNNTLFVFTSDHVSSEKMAAETRQYPGNHHTVGLIYTPDGSLRQQINDVTQQLDIMPTVLGLLGNTEPYFAFGRDILNESDRPRWSIIYNSDFKANTNSGVKTISECDTLKATVQQYYHHISERSYVVPAE